MNFKTFMGINFNMLKTEYKICKLFCILLLSAFQVFGQKQLVNIEACRDWPSLGNYGISDDGQFAWYQVSGVRNNLILTSTDGKFVKQLIGINPDFTEDSRFFLHRSSDTVKILNLIDKQETSLNSVIDAKQFSRKSTPFLLYKSRQGLFIKNLLTNQVNAYGHTKNYVINKQGTGLILYDKNKMEWVNLTNNKSRIINLGTEQSPVFDESGNKFVFTSENAIYYCDRKLNSYRKIIDNMSVHLDGEYVISAGSASFIGNGNYVKFDIEKSKSGIEREQKIISESVEVWSYKDVYIHPSQVYDKNEIATRKYRAAINLINGRVTKIENDRSFLISDISLNGYSILKWIKHSKMTPVRQMKLAPSARAK